MVALGTVGWVTGCLLPVQEPRVLGFVNSWAVFMIFLPYRCVALSYSHSEHLLSMATFYSAMA